jgi:aryl-alcohol dehydrogenase-like predicted oxidoreductase
VIVYMPLAGGLLSGKTESLDGSRTSQVEQEYGIRIGPENRQFRDFSELCRELGEPEHVVAAAWVLQHPAVASAIVGVRTVDQLAGLDRAAELELDEAASNVLMRFSISTMAAESAKAVLQRHTHGESSKSPAPPGAR